MLVEVIYDVDDFVSKIDAYTDIHYELESQIIGLDLAYVKLTLYGIGRNSSLIKCIIVKSARWRDREVRKFGTKNAIEDLRLWIEETRKELEKIAKDLNATHGRYEVWECSI